MTTPKNGAKELSNERLRHAIRTTARIKSLQCSKAANACAPRAVALPRMSVVAALVVGTLADAWRSAPLVAITRASSRAALALYMRGAENVTTGRGLAAHSIH